MDRHRNPPRMLKQLPCKEQLCVPSAHSSMSKNTGDMSFIYNSVDFMSRVLKVPLLTLARAFIWCQCVACGWAGTVETAWDVGATVGTLMTSIMPSALINI